MLKATRLFKGQDKDDEDFNQPQSEFEKHHNINLHKHGSFDMCATVWHFSRTSLSLGVEFMKWGFPFVQLTKPQLTTNSAVALYNIMMQ